jgi:hypothetical protein
MFNITPKLQGYINKVEKETGRKVIIELSKDLGLAGMQASFITDPIYIRIYLSSNQVGLQLEQSMAHELTHGFLAYAVGYCQYDPKRGISGLDKQSVGLLFTMIEDIPVNHLLEKEGFQPYAYNYLDVVKDETKALNKGVDYYRPNFKDIAFRNKFKVFRYVQAWSFLEFFTLDLSTKGILQRFEKAFRYNLPRQYKTAIQVKDIIKSNDIFTPDGYSKAIKSCLELWQLADFVEVIQ